MTRGYFKKNMMRNQAAVWREVEAPTSLVIRRITNEKQGNDRGASLFEQWLSRLDRRAAGTEIRCLAVGKARMNSIVPCTPILAIGLRINGPDDMNSQCYRVRLQCACYSDLCTVHLLQYCTVYPLQYLILTASFQSDGPRCKAQHCSSVPCPQRGTESQSELQRQP
jgi:hypothetical protein